MCRNKTYKDIQHLRSTHKLELAQIITFITVQTLFALGGWLPSTAKLQRDSRISARPLEGEGACRGGRSQGPRGDQWDSMPWGRSSPSLPLTRWNTDSHISSHLDLQVSTTTASTYSLENLKKKYWCLILFLWVQLVLRVNLFLRWNSHNTKLAKANNSATPGVKNQPHIISKHFHLPKINPVPMKWWTAIFPPQSNQPAFCFYGFTCSEHSL